jgi:hypothetical protein
VWNKQRKDDVLIDIEDVALGHETRMRWNPSNDWILSPEPVHERIIDQETFSMAKVLLSAALRQMSIRRPREQARTYHLRGLLVCAGCDRRMIGAWNNMCAHYRCKVTAADARLAAGGHPPSVYVREDRIVARLDAWLNELFGPRELGRTIDAIADADHDPSVSARLSAVHTQLMSSDERLRRYRTAMEAGADPTVVASWIAEVTAERARCTIEMDRVAGKRRMSREEIKTVVDQMADLTALLRRADPRDRATIYNELGLRLTYRHRDRLVIAETQTASHGGEVRAGRPLCRRAPRWPAVSVDHAGLEGKEAR